MPQGHEIISRGSKAVTQKDGQLWLSGELKAHPSTGQCRNRGACRHGFYLARSLWAGNRHRNGFPFIATERGLRRHPFCALGVAQQGSPSMDKKLLKRLEITRVAQITGLDRTGVEVACAIRPRGHVLQVTNGKGLSFEDAYVGAVMEAAELWAAERVQPLALKYGAYRDFEPTGWEAWPADALGTPHALWSPTTWMAWREATELFSRKPVWVPAHVVHCLPEGAPPLGVSVLPWTSNGMGAHAVFEKALVHALLEAIERDQLARALPQGFTPKALRQRLLRPESLTLAPKVESLRQRLLSRGFHVFLFDLTPPHGVGLPVAGALLLDAEEGPIPLSAGYACAFLREDALHSALLEAAQSRLTDVHGAREDAVHRSDADAAVLRKWLGATRGQRPLTAMPNVAPSKRPLQRLLQHLRRAGFSRVACVELAGAELGIHVVKVVVPGFLCSELL